MGGKSEIVDTDKGWRQIFKRVDEIESSFVRVGVLEDSEEGQEHEGDLTVAEIAAVLEYGTDDGRIPARPFMRITFDHQREQLAKMGRELIEQVISGRVTIRQALDIMGASLASAAKSTITHGVPPPNALSTAIAKARKTKGGMFKGPISLAKAFGRLGAIASVKPLIDTGRLLNAITWSVETGEE
jgi:hypothetical protein